jgi:hypothetical protein
LCEMIWYLHPQFLWLNPFKIKQRNVFLHINSFKFRFFQGPLYFSFAFPSCHNVRNNSLNIPLAQDLFVHSVEVNSVMLFRLIWSCGDALCNT